MTPMQRTVFTASILTLVATFAASTGYAQYAQYGEREHSLRLRAGLFEPAGESAYWDDTAEIFTGGADEFEDALLGFDYRMSLGEHLALLASVSAYEGEDTRQYLDFVDFRGGEIRHQATLDVASFTAGLLLRFAPHAAVRPYVGGGGGLYAWELTEDGRFIDFGTPDLEVFRSSFQDEGETFGYYLQAGLEVPLSFGWALFAEGRWHEAEDELGDAFEGFGDLDLSGREFSAGVTWTF